MRLIAISASVIALGLVALSGAPARSQTTGSTSQSAGVTQQEFRIERVTPAYWRVIIDHPPFNIFGPESIPQLSVIISQIEADPDLKVVVFESAVPGFFLTHYDFVPPLSQTTTMSPGSTGLPPLPDMLVRLSKGPVVSIVSIRGRASGVGSELALASDMRFASREKAVLSQFEIGAGFTPGGGPMARLPGLVGRGRALEILLSGEDIDGALAERYGYVNRALPDAELDGFVDALARRIASFDKQSLVDIKHLVNANTLPSDESIGENWSSFITSVQRPAAQRTIPKLMALGLQTNPDVETNLGKYVGEINATPGN